MTAVRVERLPVETFGLGHFGFDHLQIVFRSDIAPAGPQQDNWFVIEGLREPEGSEVRLAVEGWHGGTTLSEAYGGLTGEALVARIGTPESRGAREIAAEGGAVELWATLVSYAADMEAQKFPYIAMALPSSPLPTVNSSSLVASLLHHAGVEIETAMPEGLRLSPGTRTLLGTSGEDVLATGHGFTAVLAGAGDDRLFGRDSESGVDKLYGGRGNDTIHWSHGFDIVHGGEPCLDYAEDGTDTIDYSGAGHVRIEAPLRGVPHLVPDFVATYASGKDHLLSIEEIAWDDRSDRLTVGPGVGLTTPPLKIDFRGADPDGPGNVLDLSAADVGFEIVPAEIGGLQLTAHIAWPEAQDHALTVLGTDWIVGTPYGDRMVLPPGLRGVEGGAGDDVFDLRSAERLMVATGGGDDTLIIGEGAIVARSGGGTERYVIAHPEASLIVEAASVDDRIIVAWPPVHLNVAYDTGRPEDLVIQLMSGDPGSSAEIRVRDHRAGDLGLDTRQGVVLVEDPLGLMIASADGPAGSGGVATLPLLSHRELVALMESGNFRADDIDGVAVAPQADPLDPLGGG